MADDIGSIDGHVFRTPDEAERYRRFIREEGAALLDAYRAVTCPNVRAALLDLVKIAAKDASERI